MSVFVYILAYNHMFGHVKVYDVTGQPISLFSARNDIAWLCLIYVLIYSLLCILKASEILVEVVAVMLRKT